MKPLLVLAAALAAAPILEAQAPRPAPAPAPNPAPLNPVGNFSFQVLLPDGSAIGGQFTIKGEPNRWEGTISSDVAPEAPISGIAVEGQALMFSIVAPDGTSLPLRLTFAGDDFSGQLNFQGATLAIAGKRVRPQ